VLQLLMSKDYQFAAVELLSQLVIKEAFEVVHLRKFSDWCKTSKKIVRLLSKIKWNKLASVEMVTQIVRKEASEVVHFRKFPHW
jgi:hypothetical protein